MSPPPGEYAISIDRRRRMLVMEFRGIFYSAQGLAGYLDAKNAALAQLGCRPNEHVTLCDFSACVPQSGEVLALLKASLDDPAHMSSRLAVVVGSAIMRLQFQRVVKRGARATINASRRRAGSGSPVRGWLPPHQSELPSKEMVEEPRGNSRSCSHASSTR